MKPVQGTRGVTLVELLVVLAILAVSATVVGLALARAFEPEEIDPVQAEIVRLRRSAVLQGQRRTLYVHTETKEGWATALPTGAVVADTVLQDSRLTTGSGDEF